MLFLVGGAPRTGKSRLTARLMNEAGASPLYVDVLMGQLRMFSSETFDAKGLETDQSIQSRADTMLPQLLKATDDLLSSYYAPNVVIEGELISPRHVRDFAQVAGLRGHRTSAAFLINTDPDIETIIANELPAGWVKGVPESERPARLAEFLERAEITWSEAMANRQPAFDIAQGWEQATDAAFHNLTRTLHLGGRDGASIGDRPLD